MSDFSQQRFAVIGGGISGLAAAQRIQELAPAAEISLFEAAGRLGGTIQSTAKQGVLFEHGADSFIVSQELPWAGQLCETLNLDLIETAPDFRGATIVRNGKLHPVPAGLQLMVIHQMGPLLGSPLLSCWGKMRVFAERFVPQKQGEAEESLAQFTRRRYGTEMFERIIQPLVSGIYTADPECLSMSAALPQFVKLESAYGTLWHAAKHAAEARTTQGARYGLFRSPSEGMQSLIDALESHLSAVNIFKSTRVTSLKKSAAGWLLAADKQPEMCFDGVVLATSATSIPKLMGESFPAIGESAKEIEHVSTAVVCFAYDRSQVQHPLNTFGCVVPHVEGRNILAMSFTSVKLPSRAPCDQVIVRVFLGGALQSHLLEGSDADVTALAKKEVEQLLGASGSPKCELLIRWPNTTPQYNLGHQDRVASIRTAAKDMPAFEIAGNAYGGVGIPQCVKGGGLRQRT